MVCDPESGADIISDLATLGRSAIKDFDLDGSLQGAELQVLGLCPAFVNKSFPLRSAISHGVGGYGIPFSQYQAGWQDHQVRALVSLIFDRDSVDGGGGQFNL
jgi:hypothetical protein